MRRFLTQLVRFGWLEFQSCAFAIGVFLGLAVAYLVPLPIERYDALLIWCLALTFGFWAIGLETWREVLVIFAFHALGLGLELFKVAEGPWAYPGDAWTKVGGVPLFSGFMYAAVGSYICQAWRRFDLRVSHYPAALTTVLRRCRVHFTVGDARYRMPLSLSFLLIGFFLWLAENMATFLNAWRYPGQADVWEAVHTSKLGAWALLVTMSFVLVATIKAQEGRLAGTPRNKGGCHA
ncbi:DUF817 domain-containing protein [Nocardioides sp. WS12]|uniref:DUF817 domain-containing protein n=1 Tax=Nocardioides sp. WS12 TaxID=2486272 RepID=UPI0015FA2143|nr:DUF817 domain-containing protein [Nocardioides sp. WS12]